jgi:hypothetical protein
MTDKESPEKALFAFTGDSVLAEELGGGAGHHEKRNLPFSSDMAIPFWPRSWEVELDTTKSGTSRLAPTDR